MKTICLYFQVHQPFRLKRYRFFDIGSDNYYYDDYTNESIVSKIAEKCYLPTNALLLDLIKKHKNKLKVTFSISGLALDQFELYHPEVIESFRALASTGQVEFLSETYAHSLCSLKDDNEFRRQVRMHSDKIKSLFGVEPKIFRNTELIYSDEIGATIASMGYVGMLSEGAKHVLGWKSPNFVYCNNINPRLKLLLRNFKLSDDIAFRFSNQGWNEYPLTANKYAGWVSAILANEPVISLFLDYETFGEHQPASSGIFSFLMELPAAILEKGITFNTPSEIFKQSAASGAINVPYPISWADEERDLSAWLGNELQNEAFNKLYDLRHLITQISDPKLQKDWLYLQASDHFYYMCTKFYSDGDIHAYFNPYQSPYDAFINYMNVLSDFAERVKSAIPGDDALLTKVHMLENVVIEKEKEIKILESKLKERKKLTGISNIEPKTKKRTTKG